MDRDSKQRWVNLFIQVNNSMFVFLKRIEHSNDQMNS